MSISVPATITVLSLETYQAPVSVRLKGNLHHRSSFCSSCHRSYSSPFPDVFLLDEKRTQEHSHSGQPVPPLEGSIIVVVVVISIFICKSPLGLGRSKIPVFPHSLDAVWSLMDTFPRSQSHNTGEQRALSLLFHLKIYKRTQLVRVS